MRVVLPPPRSLLTLAARQEGLLSSAQCDDAGVISNRRARLIASGSWARVTRGVFDVEPLRDRRMDADHRRRRSAWLGLLACGPGAIAVGQCALALLGVGGLPRDIPPEVALPRGQFGRSRDGVRVRQLAALEPTRFGAGTVAGIVPALALALPELPRDNAVAVLDDTLHRGLLTDAGLSAVMSRMSGRRGAAHVRQWLPMVDRRAESPLETFARLACVDGGVPPDELQVEIRSTTGLLLGRGDMGWHLGGGRWLIAEIDGREFHETPAALLRDRARQNALMNTGRVDLLRFTAADIRAPTAVVTTVRAALRRASRG
jgi:hypothetical protein